MSVKKNTVGRALPEESSSPRDRSQVTGATRHWELETPRGIRGRQASALRSPSRSKLLESLGGGQPGASHLSLSSQFSTVVCYPFATRFGQRGQGLHCSDEGRVVEVSIGVVHHPRARVAEEICNGLGVHVAVFQPGSERSAEIICGDASNAGSLAYTQAAAPLRSARRSALRRDPTVRRPPMHGRRQLGQRLAARDALTSSGALN